MNRLKLSLIVFAYILVILFLATAPPGPGGESFEYADSFREGGREIYSRSGYPRPSPPPGGGSAAAAPDEAAVEDGDDGDMEEKESEAEAAAPPPPGGNLPLGLVYPLPASSIYTYEQMTSRLRWLKETYPDLIKLGSAGKSVEGRDLWSLSLGKGGKKILIVGACHAREWLTSALLVKTIETYAKAYGGGSVDGYPVREVLDQYTMVFVPMQNPDGVTLAQFGLAAFPKEKHAPLLAMKPGNSDDFTRWKANIRGVDLNRQHSAGPKGWEKHKNAPRTPRKPWFEEYPGPAPESEPESKAIAGLIRQGGFELILSYHASGNCFYWYFFQDRRHGSSIMERDLKIVRAMSEYSKYKAYPPEWESGNPSSHLTAWVVHDLKIPCITVEIGKFTTGYLKMGDLSSIWPRTRALPLVAVQNLPGYRKQFTMSYRVNPEQGGWVAVNGEVKTEGVYPYDSKVQLSALPQEHYVFVNWTENGEILGTDPVLTIRATGDRILTANFRLKEYTVTASAGEGGSVEGGGAFTYGYEAALKAIPDPGYEFDCWLENGIPVCGEKEYRFRVEGDRHLEARFKMISQ